MNIMSKIYQLIPIIKLLKIVKKYIINLSKMKNKLFTN